MATVQRPNVAEFYEDRVLPALMGRLDQAFPEFGWRREHEDAKERQEITKTREQRWRCRRRGVRVVVFR